MWKLAFVLSFISGTTLAAGLIQVPDSAVVKTPAGQTTIPAPGFQRATPLSAIVANDGSDYAEKLPKRLDGAPQAEYEGFFLNIFDGLKKNAIQNLAVLVPVDTTRGIKCLNSAEAFGFEKLSDTEYRVNCFAGTGKKITHVAEFKMHIDFVPPDCGSQAKFHTVFSDAAARTRVGAGKFYKSLEVTSCKPVAAAVDRLNFFSKVTPISTDFVKKTLEDNAELDKYVNGSRSSVKENYTPPVIADEDEKPAKKEKTTKPKRRPVSDDEEEEDRPGKNSTPSCSPDNPFCKSSGAQ